MTTTTFMNIMIVVVVVKLPPYYCKIIMIKRMGERLCESFI